MVTAGEKWYDRGYYAPWLIECAQALLLHPSFRGYNDTLAGLIEAHGYISVVDLFRTTSNYGVRGTAASLNMLGEWGYIWRDSDFPQPHSKAQPVVYRIQYKRIEDEALRLYRGDYPAFYASGQRFINQPSRKKP